MATLAAISRVKGCWARKRASSSAAPRSCSSATRASPAGAPSAARESDAELRENEAANAAASEAFFFMGCLSATNSLGTPVFFLGCRLEGLGTPFGLGNLRRVHALGERGKVLAGLIPPVLVPGGVAVDGERQPLVGLDVVRRRDALAEAQHEADVVLRPGIALVRRQQIESRRFLVIARHALAAPVHGAQERARFGVALVGPHLPDAHGRRHVLVLVGAGGLLHVGFEGLGGEGRRCEEERRQGRDDQ